MITLDALADFQCTTGMQDSGLVMWEAALTAYGELANIPEKQLSVYLSRLQFGSEKIQTNEKIYKQHVKYGKYWKSDNPYTAWDNQLTTDRRLKVAYTCWFTSATTCHNLLHPLLAAHNRERVELFMYSDDVNLLPDEMKATLAEHWYDTANLSTEGFCDKLRADGIDILIELNGHGMQQRYHVIGKHPVPVQVAWFNYAGTTGILGMDYCLTSDDIEIESLQPYYSEKIIRKHGGSSAMTVAGHFPELTSPPYEKNGYVTFGSFGQAHKVTREQVLTWCEIMRRVPDSRFIMKANILDSDAAKAIFAQHFIDGGIEPERVTLEGNTPYPAFLNAYERVDIALDTYPANAGTTTIEALLMGVPVVSQTGERYSMQLGRSILESCGHRELLCADRQAYIDKAVLLAQEPEVVARYRRTLRDEFKASDRCNMAKFVSELEDCYFEMWDRWLVSHP